MRGRPLETSGKRSAIPLWNCWRGSGPSKAPPQSAHSEDDIAPKGQSLRGDGARAGKLRQLFLEAVLKHLSL